MRRNEAAGSLSLFCCRPPHLALCLFSSFAGLFVLRGIACPSQFVPPSLSTPPRLHSKPRQVCKLICTGFYRHSLSPTISFLTVYISIAHTEYFPYSLLNSSWHEVDFSAPLTPTLSRSLANMLCFLPPYLSPMCMVLLRQTFSSPTPTSDSRYAFTATNRFWFHKSAGQEQGIQPILIPHLRYDVIRHKF